IQMHRRPVPLVATLNLRGAEVGDVRTIAEQEDRQVGAGKLDPARTQAAPHGEAEAIAVKLNPPLCCGRLDGGMGRQHRHSSRQAIDLLPPGRNGSDGSRCRRAFLSSSLAREVPTAGRRCGAYLTSIVEMFNDTPTTTLRVVPLPRDAGED